MVLVTTQETKVLQCKLLINLFVIEIHHMFAFVFQKANAYHQRQLIVGKRSHRKRCFAYAMMVDSFVISINTQ